MNHNPLWKYILILVVVVTALIYAAPNLYPADPSLQISADKGSVIDVAREESVRSVIEESGVSIKSIERNDKSMLVRLNSLDDQQDVFTPVKDSLDSLGSRFVTAQNLAPTTPGWLQSFNAKPMYLGLDLRGGVHFLMQLDMEDVISRSLKNNVDDIKAALQRAEIKYKSVTNDDSSVKVIYRNPADQDKAVDLLVRELGTDLEFTSSDTGETLARAKDTSLQEVKRFAVKQNITALRKRVNELGVAEPVIQQQGLERIVVELPGIQDTAYAKKILGSTATLEFRLVDVEADPYSAASSGVIPSGSQIYRDRTGNPVLLKRRDLVSGKHIINAASGFDSESSTPNVSITLDGVGAKLMSRLTAPNIGRPMASVFIEKLPDGRTKTEVINVATIQSELYKNFQITGLDSPDEARDLALLLRAGALAAPMTFVEERTVGPSLGQANIEQGFKSVMYGFVLVVIFMFIYYRIFGFIANIALCLNLVLIVSVLSMLQATLTLPGIAGIVLTVGMAVDANVLIFERIREELRAGQSPQAAIDSGYAKAFSTIADANITTLIAALVLFVFGTGPIKGFAVTLSIGILSSMFTAIVVTRVLANLIYGRKRGKALAI